MVLDFDKLKTASTDDLVTLVLCELSRFVDAHERLAAAVERIAPTSADLEAAAQQTETPAEPPRCPHPAELRINLASMGQEAFSTFKCGVCQETVMAQLVGA